MKLDFSRCVGALAALVVVSLATLAHAEQRVRIVAFNAEILAAPGESVTISKYRFDHARRAQFERVAAVLETLDADIINLCEVTSQKGVDLLVELLHEKGMTEYRGYHVEGKDNFMKLDVACISKLPLDEVDGQPIRLLWSPADDPTWREEFTFARDDGKIGAGSTALDRHGLYYVTIGKTKLGFLGLHLKSNPDDNYANGRRTGETEVARRIIQKEIVARGYAPIVLGDINDYDPDVPDRDETRATKTEVLKSLKDFDKQREGDELVNAASKIVRRADRYTSHWDRNENGADDPYDVKTMIDHILLDQSLMPHVKRVFIDHSTSLDVSDHFPIVVDLVLP